MVHSDEIGSQAAVSVDVEESAIEAVDCFGDTQFDDDIQIMPNEEDNDPSFASSSGRVLSSREEMASFLHQRVMRN